MKWAQRNCKQCDGIKAEIERKIEEREKWRKERTNERMEKIAEKATRTNITVFLSYGPGTDWFFSLAFILSLSLSIM